MVSIWPKVTLQGKGRGRNLGFLLPSPSLVRLSQKARVDLGVGAEGRWQGLPSLQGAASAVVALPSELTEGRN